MRARPHQLERAVDFQAGDEKALNTLLLSSARPSILGGLGGLANVTVGSYEMLVLDDERLGAVRRVLAGIAVDNDHLATDVIAHGVAGGDFLSHEHTLQYLHSAKVWRPRLAVRGGLVEGTPQAETSVGRAARQPAGSSTRTPSRPCRPMSSRAITEVISAVRARVRKRVPCLMDKSIKKSDNRALRVPQLGSMLSASKRASERSWRSQSPFDELRMTVTARRDYALSLDSHITFTVEIPS